MADNEAMESERSSSLVAKIWTAINKDGILAASFRQGADEIGIGLKAFPDSIHASEPGGLLDPTQGEIAADRKMKPPSPSEVARDKSPYVPDHGQDHGHGHGR